MKEIYKDHALCVRKDCELASTCARAIAFREVTDDDREFMIVNPNVVTGRSDCEMVAIIKTVRFARGFKQALGKVPADDANIIYHILMGHFGKNQYYDRRNGKLLLPPEEQEYIRKVFAQYAYADEVFDGYEDKEVFVPSSR